MYSVIIDSKNSNISCEGNLRICLYSSCDNIITNKAVDFINSLNGGKRASKNFFLNDLFNYISSEFEIDKLEVSYKINGITHRRIEKYNTTYLGIGTNKGNREKNIRNVLNLIKESDKIMLDDISSIYESDPVGFKNQNKFYNMVMKTRTVLKPSLLLEYVKKIEYHMGRRWNKTNHPRIIDIDILYYDDKIINNKKLNIPHKEIYNRDFVLIPLLEIDSEFKDPTNFKKLGNYVDNYSSLNRVIDKKELL